MITLFSQNESLSELNSLIVASATNPTTKFRLERSLGEGATAVAFLATMLRSDGSSPVVLKLLKPSAAALVSSAGNLALLSARKEVTALLRFNSEPFLTPFVVRILDLGQLDVRMGSAGPALSLPWIVLEYVNGGTEGTTLTERVKRCLKSSGFAFDPERANRAIECLSSGLSSVHQAGIIHRDLKPGNVLCCGERKDEILKIADFGIARMEGVAATFGPAIVGSLGYAPPEQIEARSQEIGAWSDIFALAAMVYYVLTGERYFPPSSLGEMARLVRSTSRRSILDAPGLHPDLRRRVYDCKAIDAALASATAPKPADRLRSSEEFASLLRRAIVAVDARIPQPVRVHDEDPRNEVDEENLSTVISPWSWVVRHQPGGEIGIRSVAWDADGKALAATTKGLRLWDGLSWMTPTIDGLPNAQNIHFVHRLTPGTWLVGGEGATIAVWSQGRTLLVLRGPDPSVTFELASGTLGDLLVLLGSQPENRLSLYAIAGRHWLKPLTLPRVTTINSIARLDDTRWIVAGRARDDHGFAGIYSPGDWHVESIKSCRASAYFYCATQSSHSTGLITANGGNIIRLSASSVIHETISEQIDFTAGAIDRRNYTWAGGAGSIWVRPNGSSAQWTPAWCQPLWTTPIKSIHESTDRIFAVTSDGGIVEGGNTIDT